MDVRSSDERMKARIERVEEHIRLENLHDLDGILNTFGRDARYDDEPWGDHRVGRDQVQLYYQQLLGAAPDLQIEVRHQYAMDKVVILEVTISGIQTGAWRGLPGTGRSFRFPLCAIYTFDEEDRLSGEKIYYDRATVFRQLGVFRESTSVFGRLLTAINHPLTIARAVARRIFGH
jgi:steroid delta-isomerase-like uncharacterized protein